MSNLMQASNQWASRPADERFWNLRDMSSHMENQRKSCHERDVKLSDLKIANVNGDLCLMGSQGVPAHLTNWAFGQLSLMAGAPAGYLRELPPELATKNLEYGLAKVEKDAQTKLLIHRNGHLTIRALTGTGYGRIWNMDVVRGLTPALDKGWMTPPARPSSNVDSRARPATLDDIVPGQDNFGLSVKVGDMIAPAGCYAGDRDMFVFLVNPRRIIDDGGKGLMRGVFVQNNEVGSGAFRVKTFYLENVCGNHICWGTSKVTDYRIIHKRGSIVGFDTKTIRSLGEYADSSALLEEALIRKARTVCLGSNREEVVDTLFQKRALGISKKDLDAAYGYAEKWEHTALAPPTSVWGFVHGLTRYSQTTGYADARNTLDQAAGRILDLASAA